uniref:Uncharacterized protein n=1 Tax=Eutreptiella gymnastica TaxID=73025 RepID=A0A7S4LLH4_9EUGL
MDLLTVRYGGKGQDSATRLNLEDTHGQGRSSPVDDDVLQRWKGTDRRTDTPCKAQYPSGIVLLFGKMKRQPQSGPVREDCPEAKGL